jgi:flagellar hook assembly protein FlgD
MRLREREMALGQAIACTIAILCVLPPSASAKPRTISNVFVSRLFFNPSLGQKIGITFTLAGPGLLGVLILDRDGFPVRRLVASKSKDRGKETIEWDGRDENGELVPDEAYSLKIDLVSSALSDCYFPANAKQLEIEVGKPTYNRRDGVLGYRLTQPARVHLQAGSAQRDPKTKEEVGPVLKTIVNREPRSAGSIVENWDGFDESGTIYVPDLPNFVVAIAATSLPENAIVTVGTGGATSWTP